MNFDVKKYTSLARLKITEAEEEKFAKDLGKVLDYVSDLQKVDVTNVEAMSGGTSLKNVFREDVKKDKELFAPDFPQKDGGYLKVPRILDNE